MYEFYEEERNMRGTLRDWRKALRTPATYRVGNTVRVQPQFILLVILVGLFLLILFYYNWWTSHVHSAEKWVTSVRVYNDTYPLTAPIRSGDLISYHIGIVADLDTNSKSSKPYTYNSYFKKGYLSYHTVTKKVAVTWDTQPPILLSSTYAHKGRGMELSELIVYDGRLLTFDDRSGMVFEIMSNSKVVPWIILVDGNGQVEKGFKSEWATIKDNILYVGSMGKEWTTASGQFESYDPMWVKAVNMKGEIQHLNWVNEYKAIRSSIGINWPGYMIHESGVWSASKQMWHFLPRRCSKEHYNETKDEVMGCNYLIVADAGFNYVSAVKITKQQPKFGFSSFKFIPGTNDGAIVALKTTEFEGKTATYITAFTTDGQVLLEDVHVDNHKYEGIEFI